MAFVIQAVEFANGAPCKIRGQLLRSFDPEKFDGQGFVEWTFTPQRAMKFPTAQEALKFWKTSPRCRPTREDGKPNRPLTSTTVAIRPEEDFE